VGKLENTVRAPGVATPARVKPPWPVKVTVGRQLDSACGTCSSVERNRARCASS